MANRKQRVASLLKRLQFIDLTRAVAAAPEFKKRLLTSYVDREAQRFRSYEPFRKCVGGIYGVVRGLDPTDRPDRGTLIEAVRRACKGIDENMNLEAAMCLFDQLQSDDYTAYDHPVRSLSLGMDRKCVFRFGHYIVRGGEAVFQYPYPRRTRLTEYEYSVMMSLISLAYATGDFEGAAVEIADLSCVATSQTISGQRVRSDRSPRIMRLTTDMVVDRAELQAKVNEVHGLLQEIGDEPEP